MQNSYTPGTWTLAQQSYGNGAAWAYTYNEFDQVTVRRTTNGSAGAEFQYFYNSEGALARVEQYATTLSDGEVTGRTLLSTQRYYYDSVNRLTHVRETDADGAVHAFLWSYDSNNNVTELTETVNGKTFACANAYNADQQPTQSGYGSVSKTFTYDGLGRLSQTALSSGNSTVLTTGFGYKDRDTTRTTPQVATLQNAFGNSQESFSYTYDAKGNILSVSDGTDTTTYVYDALNELTWEKNAKAQTAWQYTYDLGGNILSKTAYNYQNGTVGSQTGSVSYTYGDGSWPDLLTAYDGNTITCDEIGNPLSYRGWTFTWQGGRQLATASNGTTSLSFVYNESGLRIRKTVGTAEHRCVYRGSTLVAELTANYALYFHHDVKGSPVGFTYAAGNTETEYFYRKNLQGDIIGIVDASGVSVAEYSYDAWGNILSDPPTPGTLAAVNPLRYRGYYFDQETGLYYLKSRYYDPAVGRFINADKFAATGQGILGSNMFAYCRNNPVNVKDSNGAVPMCCIMLQDGGTGIGDAIPDITDELNDLMKNHAEELTNYYLDALENADTVYRYSRGDDPRLNVASVAFLDTIIFFIEKVRTGGVWDLKNTVYRNKNQYKYNGMIYTREDIGNIHFGYVGAALYSSGFLHLGAGVYQIYSGSKWEYWSTLFDEPRDSEMIDYGIKLYEGRSQG